MSTYCPNCLTTAEETKCPTCEEPTYALEDKGRSDELFARLRAHEGERRRRIVLALQVSFSFLCFGLLYVGLTVATGLESDLVAWMARIFAVLLLAAGFLAIPRIYPRYLVGPHGAALRSLQQSTKGAHHEDDGEKEEVKTESL